MGLKSWILGALNLSKKTMEAMQTCLDPVHNGTQSCLVTPDDIDELREHSTLAGSVKTTLGRFLLTPDRMVQIWVSLSAVIVWEELFFFFALGFLLPLAIRRRTTQQQEQQRQKLKQQQQQQEEEDELLTKKQDSNLSSSQDAPPSSSKKEPPCHHQHHPSIGETIANNIAQMAQLALAVYLVDIVKVVLQSVGFDFFSQGELPHAFARILYTAWILNRVSAIKRYILAKHTKSDPNNLSGQVQLVDRLVDACLYCVGLFVTMDSVQEDMGAAAKGFVALGSIGTMVVGLASQGLAAQLFNGLFLASSNRIAVGDFVRFSNGVSGTIIKLGWMETIIRAPDEVMMTVPNKDLADQRVSNLSRNKQSAVKQTLRFKYADIDKLPAVLETIKDEVKKACPEVIVDGSRPFRANLTRFHPDHIEAQVDFRFRLKPLGNKFFQNRQNVLLAINKAVKQYDIEFAVVDVAAVSTAVRLLTGRDVKLK